MDRWPSDGSPRCTGAAIGVVACLTVNQPRALIRYRKLLASNASWDAALADDHRRVTFLPSVAGSFQRYR